MGSGFLSGLCKEVFKVNLASFIVLGIVAVLFVFAVISSGKKGRANVMGTAVPAFIHVISRRE